MDEVSLFSVVALHDYHTPQQIIKDVVVSIFNYDPSAASDLAQCVKTFGDQEVGIYPYEIAEDYVHRANDLIAQYGVRLQFDIIPHS